MTNAERQALYKKRLKEAANPPEDENLKMVREIVQAVVPDARCEIWDFDFRIRCGALDANDETKSISFVRRNIKPDVVNMYALELKRMLGQ